MFAGDAAKMAGHFNSIITAAATIFIRHGLQILVNSVFGDVVNNFDWPLCGAEWH